MNGQRRVLLLVMSMSLLMLFPVSARSGAPNRVALVVRFGDGSVRTKCVEFNEAQITGLDTLTRSGLSVIYQASGSSVTVCKIQGEGCNYPSQPCFCQCSGGSNCIYWSYWHFKNGAWQYSQLGASSYTVRSGDVEGWVWGNGSPNNAPQPPLVDFNSVCAPQPTPTPTATTAPSATPTATHTPRPTSTDVPAVAASFSAQPERITAGECSTLRWDVDNAQAVFLDGQGVGGHASQQVCPRQTQTFELRVVSASGETRRRVTVTVIQPVVSPTTSPSAPTSTSTSLPASRKPTQVVAPQSSPTATTRPAPMASTTTASAAALTLPPTATPAPAVAARTASTPRKAAAVKARQTSAQPTEPEAVEADKEFPLELLGWAAIVGALLATLALVCVLRRQGRTP